MNFLWEKRLHKIAGNETLHGESCPVKETQAGGKMQDAGLPHLRRLDPSTGLLSLLQYPYTVAGTTGSPDCREQQNLNSVYQQVRRDGRLTLFPLF